VSQFGSQEDYLLEPNRALHARLNELGLPHGYAEHPGEHNWDYWQARLPDALAWVAGQLAAP
jgi:putative tributyrin esterase